MEILRVGIRTGLILMFAGLIGAVTFELTPTTVVSWTASMAVPRAATSGDQATPGSEYALRQLIADFQQDRPILVPMDGALAASVQSSLPRDRPMLKSLGPLQSVRYLGSSSESDVYRTLFKNGSLTWYLLIRGGVLESVRFAAPEGPYPQDWINWYALLPPDNGITRFLFGLVKLSVVTALGLVAGLRL
jgi:hypothetical protein